MAFLVEVGYAHAVVTEDSDLIACGAARILFKMDRAGHGEELVFDSLHSNRDIDLANFTPEMLLEMCLPRLPHISGTQAVHFWKTAFPF